MFVELVYNAALLVTLSVFYGALTRFRKGNNFLYRIFVGLLFGLIVIAGMNIPVKYEPGIIYDGRSVILILSGLFGGGVVSGVTILIAGVYRILIGGIGVYAGVVTIISCGLVGLFFRRIYKNKPENINLFVLWLIGVVGHVFMLLSQLILPWDRALDVIQNVWIPVLLIFPFATLIIGVLLGAEEKRIISHATIEQSKRLFQTLSDNSPVGIFRTNAVGTVTYINARLCRLADVSIDDAEGDNWLHAIHPEDRDILYEKWKKAIVSKTNFSAEFRLLNKDGRVTIVFAEAVPEIGENGSINGYIGTVKDITEQKKYEEALIRSEQNFRKVLDESPLGIRITDSNGDTVYVNSALLEIYGGTADEFIKSRLSTLYTPESYHLHQIRKEKRNKGEYVPLEYEISIINRKGEIHHLHVYRKEIIWDGGLHFQSLYRDITEKKIAEQALLKREESLREAEQIAQMGSWENDMPTGKGKWSENCYRIFGLNPFEMDISLDYFLSRIFPEDLHLIDEGYNEIMVGRKPIEKQMRITFPDGSKKWILNKIVPVFSDGELVLMKGVVMDINKRKEDEEKLKLLNKSIV
ncbi:MAG TPA: hypothetical protein DIW50_04360, partial [Prolixibacteraceae bacterium]|nr:hypothetical protein [Prolixibacteraceae bacterium]